MFWYEFVYKLVVFVVLEFFRRRFSFDDVLRGRDFFYRRKLLFFIGSLVSSIIVTDELFKFVFFFSEIDGNVFSVMIVEVLYIFIKYIYVNLLFSIVVVKKRRIIYFVNFILIFVFALFLFMFYDKYSVYRIFMLFLVCWYISM